MLRLVLFLQPTQAVFYEQLFDRCDKMKWQVQKRIIAPEIWINRTGMRRFAAPLICFAALN